jgi:hypothetical protein
MSWYSPRVCQGSVSMLHTELSYCRIAAATQAERRVFLASFSAQTVGRDPGPWRILSSVGAGGFAQTISLLPTKRC